MTMPSCVGKFGTRENVFGPMVTEGRAASKAFGLRALEDKLWHK